MGTGQDGEIQRVSRYFLHLLGNFASKEKLSEARLYIMVSGSLELVSKTSSEDLSRNHLLQNKTL